MQKKKQEQRNNNKKKKNSFPIFIPNLKTNRSFIQIGNYPKAKINV